MRWEERESKEGGIEHEKNGSRTKRVGERRWYIISRCSSEARLWSWGVLWFIMMFVMSMGKSRENESVSLRSILSVASLGW